MSKLRTMFALSAAIAVMSVMLLPGGQIRPPAAEAADCSPGKTGTLIIRIVNTATGSPLSLDGTSVIIVPDPRDWVLDLIVTDIEIADAHSSQDKDPRAGIIRIDDACSTQGSETYTATIWSLPSLPDDVVCSSTKPSASTQLAVGATAELQLEVNCQGLGASPTPTATATGTPGPAASITMTASPISVGCSGTSIITVQLRDAAGRPVQPGIPISITTNMGTLSPGSGYVTGNNGTAVVFFTAPAASGGTATILGAAGGFTGTATVTVSCGGAGTTAPPPTVGAGVITPPNTGDGGIANEGIASVLPLLSGIGVLATLAVVHMRRHRKA